AADPNRDLIYALQELARRLRGVEGPKTLILVSAGLPESITLDDYHSFADEATRARLTVYVLKPPPLNATASSNTSGLEKRFQVHDGARVISDAFDTVSFKTLAGEPVVTSASLPPGKYTLRFGFVDDQGRRASVDRPLTLGLHQAGASDLQFSDVLAGVAVGG